MIIIMYQYKLDQVEYLLSQIVFRQAAATELGLLTLLRNVFLQTLQPGSIDTIEN